jgi:hypothetical protein
MKSNASGTQITKTGINLQRLKRLCGNEVSIHQSARENALNKKEYGAQRIKLSFKCGVNNIDTSRVLVWEPLSCGTPATQTNYVVV